MELEDFLSRLDGVKRLPSGFSARCPAHDDHVASLSINAGREGGIVAMCHAGCNIEHIVDAVDLAMSDLAGEPHITAEYPYFTEDGQLLYTVERWTNPKTFRCRPGLPAPAQRVLYRTDALAWARERAATVYITEGEKDANRLAGLGLVSTTNVGGAGAWLPHYGEAVYGCPVIVIADNDDPGHAHARAVAASVAEHATSVITLAPRYGKDVSELLDLGWTLDALDPLPEAGRLGLIQARNVLTRPVLWVWQGYVPAGKVTMIEGDPGDGKSILTTDLAARWSSGMPMPDGQRTGRSINVIMVSAEDDPQDTIVPRLTVAGADLERVYLVTRGTDLSRPFTLSKDLPALAEQAMALQVGVITFDPLMALLGDDVDAHSDHSVRRALWPLHQLAIDTGVAVVVVRHLNKGTGKAVYRGGGSIGIGGAARAVYNVGRDPENPSRRVLSSVKMNIAATPDSLAYSIESGDKGPYVEWHGAIDASAQEIVDGHYRDDDDAEMVYFLNSVVENGEPMKWHDIVLAGKKEGYTDKQLRTRRGRSRLVKITGHEGRRSVRWGYLEHTLAHLPEVDPYSPLVPHGTVPVSHPSREDGPSAPPPATPGHGPMGAQGGTRAADGQMAEDTGPDDEDFQDAALAETPLVCQVCQTEEAVSRFGRPWWVVRCVAHSPLSYRA
jgi:putative DNA primase/helicase